MTGRKTGTNCRVYRLPYTHLHHIATPASATFPHPVGGFLPAPHACHSHCNSLIAVVWTRSSGDHYKTAAPPLFTFGRINCARLLLTVPPPPPHPHPRAPPPHPTLGCDAHPHPHPRTAQLYTSAQTSMHTIYTLCPYHHIHWVPFPAAGQPVPLQRCRKHSTFHQSTT